MIAYPAHPGAMEGISRHLLDGEQWVGDSTGELQSRIGPSRQLHPSIVLVHKGTMCMGWMAAARDTLAEARSNAIRLCSISVAGLSGHLGS